MLATLKTCGDHVDDGVWRRAVAIGGAHGDVEVRLHPSHPAALSATIRFPDVAALTHIVRRIRRVFDLSADPLVISAQLADDPLLAPLVRRRLGLRVPGTWDDPSRARSASEDAGAHDAFDPRDKRLAMAIAQLIGKKLLASEIAKHAERWRPWRAYAAAHLMLAAQPQTQRPRRSRIASRSLITEGTTAHAR